jgi:hypothetical protein
MPRGRSIWILELLHRLYVRSLKTLQTPVVAQRWCVLGVTNRLSRAMLVLVDWQVSFSTGSSSQNVEFITADS